LLVEHVECVDVRSDCGDQSFCLDQCCCCHDVCLSGNLLIAVKSVYIKFNFKLQLHLGVFPIF
jgi:hypothetical protein